MPPYPPLRFLPPTKKGAPRRPQGFCPDIVKIILSRIFDQTFCSSRGPAEAAERPPQGVGWLSISACFLLQCNLSTAVSMSGSIPGLNIFQKTCYPSSSLVGDVTSVRGEAPRTSTVLKLFLKSKKKIMIRVCLRPRQCRCLRSGLSYPQRQTRFRQPCPCPRGA
jgi:hypothetical protein